MKLQLPKGTRDFPPEEKILRQSIVETLKSIFELYGYSPLETPNFERYQVLASKYAGGSEILKETFRFRDQGNRELALRYDLTVPMCRFVGMNPQLKTPFKRYQIGPVYRDGPIKLGRYREFWQCDVDVVGCRDVIADAEMIKIAQEAFRQIGLKVVIEFNSRKVLEGILDYAKVKGKQKREAAMVAIDKLKKTGLAGVKREMLQNLTEGQTEKILEAIQVSGKDRVKQLERIIPSQQGREGIEEINQIQEYLKQMKVENAKFEPSLARGLAYYTGPVYEVFLQNSEIKSSVAAGGRYDNMIGDFLGGKKQYPATGISFGLDVITEAMKVTQKTKKKSTAQVYVIPIGTLKESLGIARKLREAAINTDIDLLGRGPSKNLKYANSMNIPYAILVGEEELNQGKVKLRDMGIGKESLVRVDQAAEMIK